MASSAITLDTDQAGAYEHVLRVLQTTGAEVSGQTPPVMVKFQSKYRTWLSGGINQKYDGEAVLASVGAGKSSVTLNMRLGASTLIWQILVLGIVGVLVLSTWWGSGGFVLGLFAFVFQYWVFGISGADGAAKKTAAAIQGAPIGQRAAPVVAAPVAMPPVAAAPQPVANPQPAAAATAPDGGGRTDVYDQIKKLADLRTSGAITPEEFEAKKAELLRRI